MQIRIFYTDREWQIISQKLKKQKFSDFFHSAVYAKIKGSLISEEDKMVGRDFYITNKELENTIKKMASDLKIRPAKLLAKLVFDPVLYKEQKDNDDSSIKRIP